jgi:glutamine amidotransferase
MDPVVMVVGYRMGNITSLLNAFAAVGVDARVAERPEQIKRGSHLVLPGVGAFAKGMGNLRAFGFEPEVRKWVEEGKPLLGVCVGMQLLATVGEEHGLTDGLGFVPGRAGVLRTAGLRLPHIGWNDTTAVRESALLGPAGTVEFFYYVHSFRLEPDDPSTVILRTTYGEEFAAGVQRDNVLGLQFHPEKSHAAGLAMLRRFADLRC